MIFGRTTSRKAIFKRISLLLVQLYECIEITAPPAKIDHHFACITNNLAGDCADAYDRVFSSYGDATMSQTTGFCRRSGAEH